MLFGKINLRMPIPFSSKGDEILEFFDVVPNDPALRVSFSGQAVEFTNEVGEHSTRGEPSGIWRHGRGRFGFDVYRTDSGAKGRVCTLIGRAPAASSSFAPRSTKRPPITTARNCRSGWPSWRAALR